MTVPFAFALRRWRPRHLMFAWGAYWVVLLTAVLSTALRTALLAVLAPDGHGTVSVSMANGVLTLLAKSDTAIYTGTASLLSIALWVAGPPLLLFALWAVTRSSPIAAHERVS